MTIACSEEEDKSRSAFTHILDSDSSNRPLSFIIPLLCLNLYWGWLSCSASVIYSISRLSWRLSWDLLSSVELDLTRASVRVHFFLKCKVARMESEKEVSRVRVQERKENRKYIQYLYWACLCYYIHYIVMCHLGVCTALSREWNQGVKASKYGLAEMHIYKILWRY